MSEKGTGTCQVCRVQKRKCSKTFEAMHKSKKVASVVEGSSHEMSESLQGWECANTLRVSTLAMWKLVVMDTVKIPPLQHSTQGWKWVLVLSKRVHPPTAVGH